MHKVIKNIIKNEIMTDSDKMNFLNNLENDLNTAKGIISGKYKYCNECDDYYLAESFLTETDTKDCKILTYEDPINSGGNDYVDGIAEITYSICPKGHKKEIDRKERKIISKLKG